MEDILRVDIKYDRTPLAVFRLMWLSRVRNIISGAPTSQLPEKRNDFSFTIINFPC